MTQVVWILLLAGILAGLVNYITVFKRLPMPETPPSMLRSMLIMNPPPARPRWLFWKKLLAFCRSHWEIAGYCIVGIAGALLCPLVNALVGPLKGFSEDCPPEGCKRLILFGYGFVFGICTTRLLKGVMDIVLGRLQKLERDGPGRVPAAPGQGPGRTPTQVLHAQSLSEPGSFSDIINIGNIDDNYVKGIDLSYLQQDIDWQALIKEGVQFVYIKATDGLNPPDSRAQAHANAARLHRLKIGYYHFARPYRYPGDEDVITDATLQADRVRKILSVLPPADLPLALQLGNAPIDDWDTNLGPTEYMAWIRKFLSWFDHDKKKPVIYGDKYYLEQHLPIGHDLGASYKCWLSRHTSNYLDALPPAGWQDWVIWQFTGQGSINNMENIPLDLWWREDYQ